MRDPACLNAIIGPAARTSNVLVSEYFRRNDPMSINWIRYLPVDASATANTTTISNPTPTNSSSKAVPTTTIPTPATSLPPFPSSMVPPRTTGRWCDGDSSRKCGGDNTDKKTNNVLIVSITVAVLTLGFLAAAAFYIYRTFYAPDSNSNITGTTTISKSSTHSNSKTLRDNDPEPDNPSRLVDTFLYNRAKEESTRNINTNKDPKLFRESPKSSRTAYSSNPAIQIPLQQRSKGGQTSPSSEVSLLARTKH
ncbi:hypothetical protein BGX27_009617 [Mortierella sp. AM989]|nr:hypothetical protein BGX27_009617 [Mortierella sp. AM989]